MMNNFELVERLLASYDVSVLLFSRSQEAFHVETFKEHVEKNLKTLKQGQTTDYVIIGIFHSRERCDMQYRRLVNQLEGIQLSNLTVEDLLKSI